MLLEKGDCSQSSIDGGIFRSQIQRKSFLRSSSSRMVGFGASCGLKVREERLD